MKVGMKNTALLTSLIAGQWRLFGPGICRASSCLTANSATWKKLGKAGLAAGSDGTNDKWSKNWMKTWDLQQKQEKCGKLNRKIVLNKSVKKCSHSTTKWSNDGKGWRRKISWNFNPNFSLSNTKKRDLKLLLSYWCHPLDSIRFLDISPRRWILIVCKNKYKQNARLTWVCFPPSKLCKKT